MTNGFTNGFTKSPEYLRISRRYVVATSNHGIVPIQFSGSAPTDKPDGPLSKRKDPEIPEGHPIDTDFRPLGHVIPDYDVEMPICSFGGYAKDFEAWTEPPEMPPTSWPQLAKYDYEELEVVNFPVMYELNTVYVIHGFCVLFLVVSIIGTKYELANYYAQVTLSYKFVYLMKFSQHGEYYKTGWPHFHYEPSLDIVPLTRREDGLPPESLILQFDDEKMIRHELPEGDDDADDDEWEADNYDVYQTGVVTSLNLFNLMYNFEVTEHSVRLGAVNLHMVDFLSREKNNT